MPTTDVPTNIPPGWVPWIVGGLIFVIVTLAGVIAYLFKLYNRRVVSHDKQRRELEAAHALERNRWIEERAAWDAEREAETLQLRLDYETKHRELAEGYIKQSAHDRAQHLLREEQIRKDGGELMEKMQDRAAVSTQAMVDLLQKIHQRFLGGRRARTSPGDREG